MTDVEIRVEGMSCMHCVGRVRKAVEALNGVKSLDVQIGLVKASFEEDKVTKEDIEKAISSTGYRVAS